MSGKFSTREVAVEIGHRILAQVDIASLHSIGDTAYLSGRFLGIHAPEALVRVDAHKPFGEAYTFFSVVVAAKRSERYPPTITTVITRAGETVEHFIDRVPGVVKRDLRVNFDKHNYRNRQHEEVSDGRSTEA